MELYTRGNRITRPVVIACLILLSILILYFLVKSNKDGYTARYIKISQLLSASIHLSEKSGKQIVAIRKNEDPDIKVKGHTAEGAAEYVTMGDQKSHEIITEGLHSIWSDLRYRSEEKDRPDLIKDGIPLPSLYHSEVAQFLNRDEQVDVNNIVVWVDPLDATQEYTEGGENPALLEYVMVMVCIVVNDRPIASVMHQPFVTDNNGQQGVTYWSWVNHGVSSSVMNNIQQPSTTDSNLVRVIASRSHPGDVKKVAESALKGKSIQEITAAGAGYKSLQVAQNKADLYLHTTKIKKWDTCAGDALLSAMGGAMTTRNGEAINYGLMHSEVITDGLIAARTKEQHKEFVKQLHL